MTTNKIYVVSIFLLATSLRNSWAEGNSVNLGTLQGNIFGSLIPPKNESNTLIDVYWIIEVPGDLNVYLQVVSAEMTNGDSVTMYDGDHLDSSLIAASSSNGFSCPYSFISSGSSVTVRYVGMASRSQFYVTYSVPVTSMTMLKCSEDWINLSSPGYPNNYGPNTDVIWVLYSPLYYNIEIRWQTFLTEKNKDFLTVYDGENTFIKPYIQYSGNLTSGTKIWMFSSTSNYLTLRFTTSNTTQDSGFLIHYISYPSGSGPTTPMPTTLPPPTTPPPSDLCNYHGNYTCNCYYGFTGQHCENEINFCKELITDYTGAAVTAGELCIHGTCVSSPIGASCNCNRGFTGKFCEDEIANETIIATRCALYATNVTKELDIPVGCAAGNVCIPDNLSCAIYESCERPLGWCIPKNGAASYVAEIKNLMLSHNKLIRLN